VARRRVRRAPAVAEAFGVTLHVFYVASGIDETLPTLRAMLDRGHVVDSHTDSHLSLLTADVRRLDDELALSNDLFRRKLGWASTVLRGPGGYHDGLDGKTENQRAILKNGFRWVSSQYDRDVVTEPLAYAVAAPDRHPPYAYPSGLVEIPNHGLTDRTFFDTLRNLAPDRYQHWRIAHGGTAVSDGWRAPCTAPGALDQWLAFHEQAIDYAYERGLLFVPTWHPYTHYLHDRENIALRHFLEYCRAKPDPVWVCTVRDAAALLTA
jgi:peptidoglycan/xylan/chitin deacetylase (PgdA/CDA1 family)